MAARVYSTRFLAGRAVGGTQSLTVPDGYRAVVKFAQAIFFDANTGYFLIAVNGVPLLWRASPPIHAVESRAVMVVAYEGETISMGSAGGDVAWHCSGFLFREP